MFQSGFLAIHLSIKKVDTFVFTSLFMNSKLFAMVYFICRQKRIAEMKAMQLKSKYGEVNEISAVDYVQEVNKAGEGIWVVLHLYKQG